MHEARSSRPRLVGHWPAITLADPRAISLAEPAAVSLAEPRAIT